MLYNVSIGKSFYNIPYTKEEDLPTLQDLCYRINSLVNVVLATDKNITNEQALLLSLINSFYESNSGYQNSQNSDKKYTKDDILKIISLLQKNLINL